MRPSRPAVGRHLRCRRSVRLVAGFALAPLTAGLTLSPQYGIIRGMKERIVALMTAKGNNTLNGRRPTEGGRRREARLSGVASREARR